LLQSVAWLGIIEDVCDIEMTSPSRSNYISIIIKISVAICALMHFAYEAQASTQRKSEFKAKGLEDAADRTIEMYNLGVVSGNPDGKPLAQWTPADFYKFHDNAIDELRAMISDERYDLIDRIKPTAMNRAEFVRSVMRETAKRGTTEHYYDWRFRDIPLTDVSVARPLDVPAASQRTVSANPVQLALHDAAAAVIKNPRAGAMVIEPDVAAKIGKSALSISLATDTSTYDLGYTVGALPLFRIGMPMAIAINFGQGRDNVQKAYCSIAFEIFKTGRTLDQTEVFSAGFLQARIDGKSNFEGTEKETGAFAPCASGALSVTTEDRLNFRLK
jgi:hypothetical protein